LNLEFLQSLSMNNLSYKTIYELCIAVGADLDAITKKYACLFVDSNFHTLRDHAYAYVLHAANSELFTMEEYFRNTDLLLKHAAALNLLDPDLAIKTYDFLSKFDFGALYTETSAKNVERVDRLVKMRNAMLTVVNVYDPEIYKYLTMRPCAADKWECNKLTQTAKVALNAPVICDKKILIDRFQKFTFGILEGLTGAPITKNFLCCGGSISKLAHPNTIVQNMRQTDLDIFIFANTYDERTHVLCELLKYFEKYTPYYAVVGSVVSVYLRGIRRKFQIISINASSPVEILARFDFTHLQIGIMLNGADYDVVATHSALMAYQYGATQIHNVARLKTDRMVKTLLNGFDIIKHPAVDDAHFSILMIDDSTTTSQIGKIKIEMSKYYYVPAEIDDELNVMSSIQVDSRADIIVKKYTDVMHNITIGGSFEGGYNTFSFKDFHLNHVKPNKKVVYRGNIDVFTGTGAVKLMSDALVLLDKKTLEDEIILTFECSTVFTKFVNDVLETKLWRMYTGKNITDPNCKDGILTITTPARILDSKKSRFQDQRGKPLNYDDVLAGDKVQLFFRIKIVIGNKNHINIYPICFIKLCDYVEQEIEKIEPIEQPPVDVKWATD